jgi:hypothetical protein
MSIWCFESSAFAQSNSCVQAGFIMNGLYLSMPKKKGKNDSQEINGMLNPSIKKNMYVDVKHHKNPEKKTKNPPVSLVASPRLFRLFLLACI